MSPRERTYDILLRVGEAAVIIGGMATLLAVVSA